MQILMEEPQKCEHCPESAAYRIITNSWAQSPGPAGWTVRTKADTVSLSLCTGCLIVALQKECAYHMVYRLEVSSIPDGHDFDDLLRESVRVCARHRLKTPEEFMRLGEEASDEKA